MNVDDVINDIDQRISACSEQISALTRRYHTLRNYRAIVLEEKELADFARETVKLQTGKDV